MAEDDKGYWTTNSAGITWIASSTSETTNSLKFNSGTGYTTTSPEEVPAPVFGEHEACTECERSLLCASGAEHQYYVAKTAKEQEEGESLPCVGGGNVRLRIVAGSNPYAFTFSVDTGTGFFSTTDTVMFISNGKTLLEINQSEDE